MNGTWRNNATKIWARCFRSPVEIHHKLTRARGGLLLDEVGEDYHLIALCHKHHSGADGQEAYEAGLLLEGSVRKVEGRVVYTGPDPYLTRKYR